MNAPMLSRICAQSGSSLGSKTTHCVPRQRLSSRKSAVRRTGMYFHSEASRSSPCNVRAPQMIRPLAGMERKQLMPNGFSSPFSASFRFTLSSGTPTKVASKPAGAFQTPRCASVRAKTPATAPHGAKSSFWLSCAGLGWRNRGKKSAAFLLVVPRRRHRHDEQKCRAFFPAIAPAQSRARQPERGFCSVRRRGRCFCADRRATRRLESTRWLGGDFGRGAGTEREPERRREWRTESVRHQLFALHASQRPDHLG